MLTNLSPATAEEVDRLAGFVDEEVRYATLRTNHRYQALVFMRTWLGPRWNEAIGLRVCDLNPLRKEVTFGRIVVNQNGSRTFEERFNKTEDCRTLPALTAVMDALIEHLARYRPDAGREDLVFTNNRGGHILPARQLQPRCATAGRCPRRLGRPSCHLADTSAHRRVVDVRRRPDPVRD